MSWAEEMWDSAVNKAQGMMDLKNAIQKVYELEDQLKANATDDEHNLARLAKECPYTAVKLVLKGHEEITKLKQQLAEVTNGNTA